MRTLISGSTGLIGRALVERLESAGHEVVRLVRPESVGGARGVVWQPATGTLDAAYLEGFDAVIHLSGANIADRRWSAEYKREIRDSRVLSAELLSGALASLERPPSVFACASAGGYYGDRGAEWLSESAARGDDFLAEATGEWEDATAAASDAGIRVLKLRIGVALSGAGGALARMLPIFKLGLGGRLGGGGQYFSWLTRADTVDAILWTLEREDISGAVNLSSPNPVTNAEFTRELARQLRRPALFAVPKFALRIAQGEVADVVFSSIRMKPAVLVESGFEFSHPRIEEALRWAMTDSDD